MNLDPYQNGSYLDPSEGIAVFTDGSATTRGDRDGGWAWIAIDAFIGEDQGAGYVSQTTISRMELQAPAEALIALHVEYGPCDVLIYSDSKYVVLGFTDKTRKRNTNNDCWVRLEEAAALHTSVTMEHVKGHSDSAYNNAVDKLAVNTRKQL